MITLYKYEIDILLRLYDELLTSDFELLDEEKEIFESLEH